MSETNADLATGALRRRKLRDAALVLPLLGIFLFLTPIPRIFISEPDPQGIPRVFAYIYGTWVLLILASAWISRKLTQSEAEDSHTNGPDL